VFFVYLFLVSGGKWDGRMGGWEDGSDDNATTTTTRQNNSSHLSTQDERKLN